MYLKEKMNFFYYLQVHLECSFREVYPQVGYSDIFIYVCRLGSFLGFKILNFNIFFF